jgi:hypothetical protein
MCGYSHQEPNDNCEQCDGIGVILTDHGYEVSDAVELVLMQKGLIPKKRIKVEGSN